MARRQLPIGIQSFRRIREQDCYYVDKTPHIQRLVDMGDFYFLSRPRRFGKSLLVDTLRELFEGNEPLFRGLDIHEHWDWSTKHPVVRLSFGGKYDEPGDLEQSITNQLAIIERNAGLDPAKPPCSGPERLRDLLDRLHHATGRQVVVLVDEYDKPILDVIDHPEMATANRDYLRGFYGIIKDSPQDVRFVFVTGVSMFSRVSLFSGLNNLRNISLDPNYATICGYTDRDLDTVFAPELPGLDRDEIREWYNGYHWLGDEKLYNPFDLLLLFETRNFEAHWFETGSPTFLFRMMMERGMSPMELEQRTTDARKLSRFDVGDIGIDALLFQTGYLTITSEERRGHRTLYTLDYPNFEVLQSLNDGLLGYITGPENGVADQGDELGRLLVDNDFNGFADRLKSFFAGIPYQWQGTNSPARYEAWYAGMLYACFRTIGLDLRVEDSSGRGRADMVVLHGGQVFVFEFKMTDGEGNGKSVAQSAIEQIQSKGYAEKYRDRGEPIHLVGVAFSRDARNVSAVKVVSA
ncbi:MAG: ATP-binding protein [Gammaproteobacteria bacterium]|nr:ATP-binding protein [Gammaproteobacteria bacterium]MYG65960.1 ATP-binding protein [Gammaproteobacteria bacterium]